MSTAAGLGALVVGIVVVVWAADVLVDGLLGVGRRLGVAPFVLAVALSGFETENLAAGIAVNAKGLPGAAAGTFLGGITFLALGVAGLGGLIAPIRVELPRPFLVWTALTPLPLLAFAVLVAVMVVWKHRGNIARLRAGTEPRFVKDVKRVHTP